MKEINAITERDGLAAFRRRLAQYPDDALLTTDDVAELFGVKPRTAQGWARDGLLGAIQVNRQTGWRSTPAEVLQLAEDRYRPSRRQGQPEAA